MVFQLNKRHLETGFIPSDEVSHYVGFPVVVAELSKLPHWLSTQQAANLPERIARQRYSTTLAARTRGIHDLLGLHDLTTEKGGTFTIEDAEELALSPYMIVRSSSYSFDLPHIPFRHWQDVQAQGIAAVVNNPLTHFWAPKPGSTMPYVVPGIYSDREITAIKDSAGAPYMTAFKKAAAIILCGSLDDRGEDYWPMETGIPAQFLQKYPPHAPHQLLGMLHEMRHLMQLAYTPDKRSTEGEFRGFLVDYYTEADADMFAHAVLQQAAQNHTINLTDEMRANIETTLKMDRDKRYLGLLFNHPKYWFAPFLDAIEQGWTPPDFYQVHQAVMEIRLHLLAEADRQECFFRQWDRPDPIASSEFHQAVAGWRQYPGATAYFPEHPKSIAGTQLTSGTMIDPPDNTQWRGIDNLYLTWREEQLFSQPDIFYTLLNGAILRGTFGQHNLTATIAQRILDAARRINPILCQGENVPERIQLPRIGVNSPHL